MLHNVAYLQMIQLIDNNKILLNAKLDLQKKGLNNQQNNDRVNGSGMDEFTVISGKFTTNIPEDVARCSLFVDDVVD